MARVTLGAHFLRPFQELRDGELWHSLIGYRQWPYYRDEAGYITQNENLLLINLWLVQLRFTWVTRAKVE